MSDKFFFKGRKTPRPRYEIFGYNTQRKIKLGSDELPLQLTVTSEERQQEIALLLKENGLIGHIALDLNGVDNITDLEGILNKPKTTLFDKKPNRNDICPCGSGKKYKKCCQSE